MRMLTSGWRDRDHWRRSRPSSSPGKPNYKIWHIVQIISSPLNLHSRPSSVLLYSLHDHKVWGGRIFCLMYTCRELIPGSVTSVFDHRYDYYCGPGHIHSSGSDIQTSQYWVFSIHTRAPCVIRVSVLVMNTIKFTPHNCYVFCVHDDSLSSQSRHSRDGYWDIWYIR